MLEKSFYQLKMETEAILDEEKKKLEAKQDKTQQEIEALVDLNITYKLTGGGKDAWTDVPILLASDKQRYIKPVNNSVTNTQNEILELKEKDNKINSLENENRTYHASSLTQIQTIEMLDHEIIIFGQNKIQSVIEMEQLKTSNASLEQLLKSKEDATTSLNGENKNLSTTNQLITGMVETQKVLLQAKANEMELLRQNMERQLADEKKRVEVLEQEIRALKQEMVQDQTHVQNTKHFNNNIINPANVESSLGASWW